MTAASSRGPDWSSRLPFGGLRGRLTWLYAGLFGVTLLLIFLAALVAVTRNAERQVQGELAASGAVFDRIVELRAAELKQAADVLSRDFGFRAAVATEDDATVASALDNLRARLGVDLAFVIGPDGVTTVSAGASLNGLRAATVAAINDSEAGVSGLLTLGEASYFGVSAPIEAPERVGWVVFARKLDAASLVDLQRLAAIPIQSAVLVTDQAGRARAAVSATGPTSPEALAAWLPAEGTDAALIDGAATLARPLATLNPDDRAVLLLRYPFAAAMAPYRPLLGMVLAVGIAGLLVAVLGSWAIARSITRPIVALEHAAGRLRDGEAATVTADGAHEIVSLAQSFNAMAAGIRERETALKAARDVAETASGAKDVFLANMSHEVRTPLNGVLGLAGVLVTTPLNDRQRQMMTLLERSAGELRDVLGHVLDLTSLRSGRPVLHAAPFDMAALLDRVCADAARAATAKGLTFEADLSLPEPAAVIGDEARTACILEALLSNAVKFTDTGLVSITARLDAGAGWRVRVCDTGIGFAQADAETLFTPFHQADGSSTRRHGGAGLGLSLARELARAMGGELVATGDPGRGATFEATLPLQPALVAAPPPNEVQEDAGPLRVLVADDHQTNRRVVELILNAVGAEMVGVENGAEALAAFDDGAFDAVLMDIQMPVMDGLEAIRGIRAREVASHARPTAIVVLSANALPAHRADSLAAGADDHVDKPVSAPALIEAIERAMTRRGRIAA